MEEKLKAKRKAASKLAIEQIEDESTVLFENSNSKFEGSELKLVFEEIDKARHTARYIKAPVALDTNDLANFNTE